MHVLFVGFVWPEPTSSAAGQNIISYIKAAQHNHWQVSFCSAAQTTPQTFDLSSMNVKMFSIQLNCDSFNVKIEELQPDIIIFDRYLSFEQFAWRVKKTCPKAMLILDIEDLHCLRAARQALLKQQNAPLTFMQQTDITQCANLPLLHNDIALREIACVLQADLTIVLSGFEKALLIEHFNVPSNQVAHVPFILPGSCKALSNTSMSAEHKQNFVFIGNFRHAPNYHAVKILAEQCWPKIYKALHRDYPNISCNVYGAYMSPKAKQLENKKLGFFVHGFAQHQFTVIQQARIMLAPISFGAGVKGKLLDAMQCNTPSVTTPIGCEGITNKPWAGEIASSIDEFVVAAIRLYTDQQKWQQAHQNGQDILLSDYNTQTNRASFINIIDAKISTIKSDRQSNFLHKMLSHHQFQTSKYMSQWIEAKSK